MRVIHQETNWESEDNFGVYLDDGTEVGRYCIVENPPQEVAEFRAMLEAVVGEATAPLQEELAELRMERNRLAQLRRLASESKKPEARLLLEFLDLVAPC